MISKVKNDLFDYKNRYIMQMKDGFKFSLDSLLLAEFVNIKKDDKKILDMCTGNAPVPLVLSLKSDAEIIGFEIQKEISELALESVKINGLEKNIKIINDDIKNIDNYFDSNTFDIITCNPPYFKKKEDSIINENIVKSIARHEIEMELEDVMLISKSLLKNEGSLVLVHRTDRLIEIIELMRKHNIEPKRMRLIYPKINTESNLVLIDGRKNGKKGLKILPPLYIHNDDNSYTKEVLEMFGK